MSLFDHMEHLVYLGHLRGISGRTDGLAQGTLYRSTHTLEYVFLCCDSLSYGQSRTCTLCHVYGPTVEEIDVMKIRNQQYVKMYPKEKCVVEMKRDFQRYLDTRCPGTFILYSIFLEYLREWDACYDKFCVMSFRENFVRKMRMSIYLAAREMVWSENFEEFAWEGVQQMSDMDTMQVWDNAKINAIIMKRSM